MTSICFPTAGSLLANAQARVFKFVLVLAWVCISVSLLEDALQGFLHMHVTGVAIRFYECVKKEKKKKKEGKHRSSISN